MCATINDFSNLRNSLAMVHTPIVTSLQLTSTVRDSLSCLQRFTQSSPLKKQLDAINLFSEKLLSIQQTSHALSNTITLPIKTIKALASFTSPLDKYVSAVNHTIDIANSFSEFYPLKNLQAIQQRISSIHSTVMGYANMAESFSIDFDDSLKEYIDVLNAPFTPSLDSEVSNICNTIHNSFSEFCSEDAEVLDSIETAIPKQITSATIYNFIMLVITLIACLSNILPDKTIESIGNNISRLTEISIKQIETESQRLEQDRLQTELQEQLLEEEKKQTDLLQSIVNSNTDSENEE